MFTSFVQFGLFAAASLITCIAYQAIPNALDRLQDTEKTSAIVHSHVFTTFVRICGMDHLVMACGMAMVFFARTEPWLPWFIVFSAWAVAIISSVSAILIRKAADE